MGILSDKEKRELLRFSRSRSLRNDFQQIEKNRRDLCIKSGPMTADDYIKFATATNAMIDHLRKPFIKIKGNNFKI
ncbi:MAG: hypothetical protein KAJ66_05165 [Candidatus Omnitrophica bacterium]|nr:hypothetical protein [Candidatus Omnitrophota bacterium]